jgi:hypothetical protein
MIAVAIVGSILVTAVGAFCIGYFAQELLPLPNQ